MYGDLAMEDFPRAGLLWKTSGHCWWANLPVDFFFPPQAYSGLVFVGEVA